MTSVAKAHSVSAHNRIKLSLTLSSDTARRLAKTRLLKGLRKGRAKHRRLVRTYFDTPRYVLRKSGIALYVQTVGKHHMQTVKAPFQGPPGLHSYTEWTVSIDGKQPDLNHFQDFDLSPHLTKRHRRRRFRAVFTTEIDRKIYKLKTRDAVIELSIDRGTIQPTRNNGNRAESICEVGFELLSGDAARLLDVALSVCENFDVGLIHSSNEDRGYAMASPALQPRPTKAKKLSLDPDMTAGAAFLQIATATLEHLYANEVSTLKGRPTAIHQTRVAMRRLRAALRAFKKLLPYHQRKAFNSEFRWFQQRLASARDWHVFLDETLPLIKASQHTDAILIEQLQRLAHKQRRLATREAIAQLESRRYARLILQFKKWLVKLETEIPEHTFNQPIAPFAQRVLRKTRQDLVVEPRSLAHLPAENLHGLRKQGKKARYATEFFSSLWSGPDVHPYLKLMEGLQNRFGEANDAAVARQILWSVPPGRLDIKLVRLVQGWSQQRVKGRTSAAQPYWRRFRGADPFWKN